MHTFIGRLNTGLSARQSPSQSPIRPAHGDGPPRELQPSTFGCSARCSPRPSSIGPDLQGNRVFVLNVLVAFFDGSPELVCRLASCFGIVSILGRQMRPTARRTT